MAITWPLISKPKFLRLYIFAHSRLYSRGKQVCAFPGLLSSGKDFRTVILTLSSLAGFPTALGVHLVLWRAFLCLKLGTRIGILLASIGQSCLAGVAYLPYLAQLQSISFYPPADLSRAHSSSTPIPKCHCRSEGIGIGRRTRLAHPPYSFFVDSASL